MFPTIKDLVTGVVVFDHYSSGELWYRHSNTGFEFPINIQDTGDAKFFPEDKALYFMRWMRKHLDMLKKAQQEQNN